MASRHVENAGASESALTVEGSARKPFDEDAAIRHLLMDIRKRTIELTQLAETSPARRTDVRYRLLRMLAESYGER